MIENVSTQLTVFHCFAHCLLPGRAFASLYALLFLEKEAEIGGRARGWGKTLTLPCLSTGTWQSWSNSEKLLNIIALIKCEDHHTKKLI